jgi:RNA polymerase subunit RPABC4/transcription elongation factor Spt4
MDPNGKDPIEGYVVKERYKLCQSCSNFIYYSSREIFCTVCGGKLIEACPQCQEAIIYPTARFCPVCGTALLTARPAS